MLRFFNAFVLFILLISHAYGQTVSPRFRVCHGYDCHYRTIVVLTKSDLSKIASYFATVHNGVDEREALKKAVAVYEERATEIIGVRDEPKMAFGRPNRKGQMDCVDESTNTEAFLQYLQTSGLMKYHKTTGRDSRGMFIDGRYPHWTAVIKDQDNVKWAVDSWYEAGGGEPDILILKDWKKRGRGGER